ncbi:helix-turn-helix domain-containing protein [Rhodococcus spelaei]|uniref:Helix-turn-helix domain-containing protein n=1 Tax=Rhodococcus spelaei TaxID=2546320 RepID=A0A541BM62_9NOCA|nr:helix-turn-helix domain-containing protein [Rhodococcus spelaei]TQF73422.1 helix-turn-helix domain-containing protein [Rhodococcus spelaei]
MDPDPHSDISAVSALEEPARRRLYDYVRAHHDPISRDEAAEALGMARPTAAFHLDKLADEGLLTVEFARRSGRSGPGAGRPSKLYRRSDRQVVVQLPERSYELAGQLLAQAIDDSERTGEPPRTILGRRARDLGRAVGTEAGPSDADLLATLERCGYEPRDEGRDIVLANCPFHTLAKAHTDMVCGMNLELIEGLIDGTGCAGRAARLAPADGYCCVRIETTPAAPDR